MLINCAGFFFKILWITGTFLPVPKYPGGILQMRHDTPKPPCLAPMPSQRLLLYGERLWLTKRDDIFRMVTLNSRDLGMEYSFELTGTNEREVMRKFIEYAETELKMPVLTADTIYRVQMAIKK